MLLVRSEIERDGSGLRFVVDESVASEVKVHTSVSVPLTDHPEQEKRKIRVCGKQQDVQGKD